MYTNNMSTTREIDIRSERRIVENRNRRQQEMRKHFLMFFITTCLIITCSVSVCGFYSNAKNSSVEGACKYYKSIEVSEDDTLWSIAGTYMDRNHYVSIYDYIEEVKFMNALTDDEIHYGKYLIIPYYCHQ